ncbi:MAG: methyltransferase domain-containing protein [Pyrinomonadaceae bacterium]
MKPKEGESGFEWQISVWERMSEVYAREIDRRFLPIVEAVIARASLKVGEDVLDLGTGTGSVAILAATGVGRAGRVTGVDISPEMLLLARERAAALGADNLEFCEGRAEAIPADDSSFDVILASLSLMYAIDRSAAAREMARVLRPGGRLVAAVWAAPDECDIVAFQQKAGSFASTPPVEGVGPGSMADPGPFLEQLRQAGIEARAEREDFGFDFDDFETAWEVLAGVTAAQLTPEVRKEAKKAVRDLMWKGIKGPKPFRNATQFIIGRV